MQARKLIRSNVCGPLSSGHLLSVLVPLPEGERVILRVLADDEVAHLGHCGFGHADLAAEFLDLRGRFIHRRNGNVISDALLSRILAPQQSAVRRVISAARVNVPVFYRPG